MRIEAQETQIAVDEQGLSLTAVGKRKLWHTGR
jgi:hypothetical protein